MKIVFFGTPEPAAEVLKTLIETKQDIAAVVTYERNAWGNKTGDVVQSAQVAALKGAP